MHSEQTHNGKPDLSGMYWSRRPQVSVCLEGDNAILFDPDTGREKVINRTGFTIWKAMTGQTQIEDMAKDLAGLFEVPLSDEVLSDTEGFARELFLDGYAGINDVPSSKPEPLESYSWIHEAPRDFDVSLTGRCNLKCPYCFYADEMAGRWDSPTPAWLGFFLELKNLAVRRLTLSGGEVFLRSDFWQLIDGIVDARMRFSILSNGTLLTEKTLDQLITHDRRRRLDGIQISIDGSCAAVHDKSRGQGSFHKALRGLRMLKEAGFPVTVRMTVNRHNVDDLENTARMLIEEIGLPGFSTNDAFPMGAGCAHQDRITMTSKQRLQAMKTLVALEKRYPGRIRASAGSLAYWHMFREMEQAKATGRLTERWSMGRLSSCGCMFLKLAVHHDGVIAPCNMLAHASLGTIGDAAIRDIWQNHPLLKEMRWRKSISMSQVPECQGCEWIPFCNGGCPAVEYTQTGNLYRINPESCYRRFLEETGGLPETVES